MYDFEALVGELLQSRPELDRDELMRRIERKKETVGAGYLTNQGALFLVAGELGVSLRKDELSSDLTIKDLYAGANDVTVVSRVLATYPEATFDKKDGGTGKYKRLVLFDGPNQVKLTAWDEKADEVAKISPKVDSVVRVRNGYVKQGLDGKPTLNLGKRGDVEVVDDEKISAKLPPLAAVTEKLAAVSQERPYAAVDVVVSSEPRFSEFVRSDGSPGSLFQFGVARGDGKGELRVVIWSPASKPELKRGQRVVVTNVRSRRSAGGDFEIHGDAGSEFLRGLNNEKMEMRIVSVERRSNATDILGLDRGRKMVEVESSGQAVSLSVGNAIVVAYESELDGRLLCSGPDSIQLIDDGAFPSMEELATKLKDAKVDESRIVVEVIALSRGTVDEVNLKDGSTAKKGELVIGDDTDEIKLVAWRGLAGKVDGFQPGERLRIAGAVVKPTRTGGHVLEVSGRTVIERIRSRS